jgi:hypothetical protein
MKYLFANIRTLLDSKALIPADIKTFAKRIPCYDLLGLVGS